MIRFLLLAFLLALSPLSIAQAQTITLAHDTIPDYCFSPTRTASVTGNWSDTATWGGSSVPGAGAIVRINNGVTVTYDVNSATAIKAVCPHGILDFGTSGTKRLVTSELLVYSDGELRIGTLASPFTGSATVEFSGTLDTGTVGSPGTDPSQYGVGLLVIGKIRVNGVVKTGFLRLGAVANAGATTLTLSSIPTGWNSGDDVTIPDSIPRQFGASGVNQTPGLEWDQFGTVTKRFDRRTLSANVTTTSASLNSALTHNHPCGKNHAGNCDYYPHVGNLTKNIVFKSTSPAGVRGHSQYFERADVDIRNALYKDMGRTLIADLHCTLRTTGASAGGGSDCTEGTGTITQIGTNQKGRYAVHFHHLYGPVNPGNTGYQYTFKGNAIADGTKWPLAIHNTSYGLVQDNVIAHFDGPGIMLEDGNEHFNLIDGNFLTGASSNVTPRAGDGGNSGAAGRESAGIWGQGGSANNYVTNNVVGGLWNASGEIVSSVGYKFAPPRFSLIKIPNFRGADLMNSNEYSIEHPRSVALLQFEGNEAYQMTSAMTVWQTGTDGYTLRPNMAVSTVKNLVAWNVFEEAFFGYPIHNFVFDGFIVRGDPIKRALWGWTSGDYENDTVTIRNANIQNVNIAVGQLWGMDRTLTYENSISHTVTGIEINGHFVPGAGGLPQGNRVNIIRNVVHATIGGNPLQTIWMRYNPTSDPNVPSNDNFFSDTLLMTTTVEDYQGGTQDFNVYFDEQASQAVSGGLAPCTDTTTFPEIDGIVCNVSAGGGAGSSRAQGARLGGGVVIK